jgi:hypothetical protein
MKKTLLPVAVVAFALVVAAFAWLQAQDQDGPPPDKWAEIQQNNKKIGEALDQIERNLNFIKARSMSGGRQP